MYGVQVTSSLNVNMVFEWQRIENTSHVNQKEKYMNIWTIFEAGRCRRNFPKHFRMRELRLLCFALSNGNTCKSQLHCSGSLRLFICRKQKCFVNTSTDSAKPTPVQHLRIFRCSQAGLVELLTQLTSTSTKRCINSWVKSHSLSHALFWPPRVWRRDYSDGPSIFERRMLISEGGAPSLCLSEVRWEEGGKKRHKRELFLFRWLAARHVLYGGFCPWKIHVAVTWRADGAACCHCGCRGDGRAHSRA